MNDAVQLPRAPFGRDDSTVLPYLFSLLKKLLQQRGIDISRLTSESGIALEGLDDQDTLLTFNQAEKIIMNALALSGEPGLGLVLGEHESWQDWGMLGYAIFSCKSGWEAMEIASSYYQTSTSMTNLDISLEDEVFSFSSTPTHSVSDEIHRFLLEEDFGGFTSFIREAQGNESNAMEVSFTYSEPDYVQQYHDFFRCPIIFDAPVSRVLMPASILDFHIKSYNPVAESMAIKLCDEILSQQNANRGLVNKVYLTLLKNPDKFLSVEEVAQELGMSERNLRRMLKELNTSYRDILNDVRKEIAIRYLQGSDLSMEHIAELVGFSDSSSFYRSFKKWTGRAPTSYRS
jgi:AraC-like DNA-binding protein